MEQSGRADQAANLTSRGLGASCQPSGGAKGRVLTSYLGLLYQIRSRSRAWLKKWTSLFFILKSMACKRDNRVRAGLLSAHTIGDKLQVFHWPVNNIDFVILLSTNLWTATGAPFVVSIRQMASLLGVLPVPNAKKPSRMPAGLHANDGRRCVSCLGACCHGRGRGRACHHGHPVVCHPCPCRPWVPGCRTPFVVRR